MGYEVNSARIAGLSGLIALSAPAAHAQGVPMESNVQSLHYAIGMDWFASTDSDKTDVVKGGVNLDWHFRSPEEYQGLRLERAWIKPLGQQSKGFDRAYLRYADKAGHWAWNGQVGSDGQTVLGSFSIHDDARFRKEFFVEREILETPQGATRRIYYTFAGGAVDLPIDDRNNFTVVAGVQPFTGDNVRIHLRANFVHVLKPSAGLSLQLRARYFHSSAPGQFDYFSPRWYAEVLPVIQVRRYSAGWRYSIAGGLGGQRDSGSQWRTSRYLNVQVTSPVVGRNLFLNASAIYSNTPVGSGYVYSYGQLTAGLTAAF